MKLVGKKEFVVVTYSFDKKTFVVHVVILNLDLQIYNSCITQLASLFTDNTLTVIFPKYANFANVIFLKFAAKLLKSTKINNYPTVPVDSQQSLYSSIHGLEPNELKTLKTYIETNLVNSFIWAFKLSLGAPIFFFQNSEHRF